MTKEPDVVKVPPILSQIMREEYMSLDDCTLLLTASNRYLHDDNGDDGDDDAHSYFTSTVETTLQVQTLGLSLLLGTQHSLPRSSEIGHLDSHATFAEGHKTRLGANGLDISSRQIVLLGDELV